MTPRQKKKRQINWQAVEHVGNDADEGGFLGDEEAQLERTVAKPDSLLPSPARELVPGPQSVPQDEPKPAVTTGPGTKAVAEPDSPPEQQPNHVPATPPAATPEPAPEPQATATPKPEATPQAEPSVPSVPAEPATESEATPQAEPSVPAEPEAPAQPATKPATSPATPPVSENPGGLTSPQQKDQEPTALFPPRTPRARGVNDGPLFTAAGGEAPILRTKKRTAKLKPAQSLVVASFIDQRTQRNWAIWSGRLVPEVTTRLEDRAFDDANSSGRSRLKSGHYLDAALKALPEDPAEIAEIANGWLIDRWGGEHPPGVNAQFSVSPLAADRLSGLKRSLRGYRHGIIIDVVCAAADRILDVLAEEGPMNA